MGLLTKKLDNIKTIQRIHFIDDSDNYANHFEHRSYIKGIKIYSHLRILRNTGVNIQMPTL